jgi:hypothetical protein
MMTISVTAEKLTDDEITLLHIHDGATEINGPVVIDLDFASNGPNGCVSNVDRQLLEDITHHPEEYYLNVHIQASPSGAARGQLSESPVTASYLWNAENDKELIKIGDGVCLCAPKFAVNFEARAARTVSRIALELSGDEHASRTERKVPYFTFGDNARGNVYGRNLGVGHYELTAIPDNKSSLASSISFELIAC